MTDFQSSSTASGYGIAPDGFRLPASTRVGRVRLQVADLRRSLDYYERMLGLRVLRSSGGQAALGPQTGEATLIELHERPGASPAPQRGRLGLYHFAILVPDRAALGRFVAHLGEIGAQAGASDHLVSEALYLQDPDGLGIEVYADRPRDAWRHRERQLVMATEPLDLASLARAGGGDAWTGMPPGTVVGHVHLHVGDIEAADRFYHSGLGLDRVVWSYPGALFLSAGGYHHHLGLNTWAGPRAEPPREGDARMIDWEVVLPDTGAVESAAASLAEHGYAVSVSPDGDRRVVDPWGNVLRLTVGSGSAAAGQAG